MDYKKLLQQKKGVAGLTILLSLIAMIFVVGILLMAFVIAGVKLQDTITDTEAIAVINETTLSMQDASDWFGTYIVMGSIVVIILLVVIIINAVRSGGLMGGGGA